ncbi:CoA transferase [Burkholderia humptydooensis]|uniref:CoA transferase n=3 Tax=Burkholderia humptydooensis TaxID=430531 RepID=A0A7U4P9T1_9BURK|nr:MULTISPECIES: CoA transferase [Burkholderia]AJY39440.1 coA-transferase III family protein [Burkholderia sp. 2002721687]ALX45605.1 acyl-CoA transferase [Burkholderia humptydooensis]EIP86556.1 CoA transferase, CAIB/BAIF family protein [Burkholderia humptydooensis MSMB43]QPS47093.1 CoA transferase [Burkholderia humptydooensis]
MFDLSSSSQSEQSGHARTAAYLREIWQAANGDPDLLHALDFSGAGVLPSVFPVTDFASAVIGAASVALAEFVHRATGTLPGVRVDRRYASIWFGTSLRPRGWDMPPLWDAIAGDYRTADGWIRLHTNAPHHRDAALAVLAVLGTRPDRQAVARAVEQWRGDALESAVVEHGGCAAVMHTQDEWARHPQGLAVSAEPLMIHDDVSVDGKRPAWPTSAERPLYGVRVLDLTRILAGPVATRFLAGFGAQVLRIDPIGWDEPGTVPEVVLGKRCARVDLKSGEGRALLRRLIGEADVMVHGYRPGALDRLGFDADERRRINPGLVDVSLDAYGWSGPWRARRGFDSLVQTSAGIVAAGMRETGGERPVPLPVQALDHGAGYLLATAAIRGLARRLATGVGARMRASLARTAVLLVSGGSQEADRPPIARETADDLDAWSEQTSWGPAQRVRAPVAIERAPVQWPHPARALGTSPAEW